MFYLKAHSGIKAHGLYVLLVHGNSLRMNILNGPLYEVTPNTSSSIIRIHEKHLNGCHIIT